MASDKISEIYEQHIRPLPAEDRLQLLVLVARDLSPQSPNETSMHNIMELHGLGKEIWAGVDAQAYVNQLRDEWDKPE